MTSELVAFQGEHGAYSEEAIYRHFGDDAETLPCESFREIFQAIQRGRATHGMVPVENALTGTIAQVYELLIEHDFRVQAEHLLPIQHHLLAPAGHQAGRREAGKLAPAGAGAVRGDAAPARLGSDGDLRHGGRGARAGRETGAEHRGDRQRVCGQALRARSARQRH